LRSWMAMTGGPVVRPPVVPEKGRAG